jgi:two-component system, response regulator / RNA-binding antiterminator
MTTFIPGDKTLHSDLGACQQEVDQLREALGTRPVIDQAKGMLIARHGCSPEEAFQMLSAASQRENRKLRDVAEAMVEGAQQRESA